MTAELTAVTAAASPWEPATLWINGKKVERGAKLVLLRGQDNEVTVEAPPEIARELNLGLAENDGLTIEALPKFGEWVTRVNGQFTWKIRPEAGKSGRVTLVFFSREVDEVWEHLSLVISRDLADEVTVLLDGVPLPASGADFIVGEAKRLTLDYKNAEVLKGALLALDLIPVSGLETGDVVSYPSFGKLFTTHEWKLNAIRVKSGTFKLKLSSIAEQAVLFTPPNRLSIPSANLIFDWWGTDAPLPPQTTRASTVSIPYVVGVRTRYSGTVPVAGVPVKIVVPYFGTYEGTTNAKGYFATPFFVYRSVGLRKITAEAVLPDGKRTAEVLLDIYRAE